MAVREELVTTDKVSVIGKSGAVPKGLVTKNVEKSLHIKMMKLSLKNRKQPSDLWGKQPRMLLMAASIPGYNFKKTEVNAFILKAAKKKVLLAAHRIKQEGIGRTLNRESLLVSTGEMKLSGDLAERKASGGPLCVLSVEKLSSQKRNIIVTLWSVGKLSTWRMIIFNTVWTNPMVRFLRRVLLRFLRVLPRFLMIYLMSLSSRILLMLFLMASIVKSTTTKAGDNVKN